MNNEVKTKTAFDKWLQKKEEEKETKPPSFFKKISGCYCKLWIRKTTTHYVKKKDTKEVTPEASPW
jgi:hypothetical protein